MKNYLLTLCSFVILMACTENEEAMLSIDPAVSEISVNTEGGVYTFNITTNQSQWNVSASDSWLQVIKGPNIFTVNVSENTGAERTASIQVSAGDAASIAITVKQSAAHCTLTVQNLPTQQPGTFGNVEIVSGNTSDNPAESPVTVKATPANGYIFAGWINDASSTALISTDNLYTFDIVENTLLYAIFIASGESNITEIHSTWELSQIGSGGSGKNLWGLGRKYKLMTDLEVREWIPVANGNSNDTHFTGVFDGNLHAITIKSIMKTDNNGYNNRFVGIFGIVGLYGAVQNLTVKGEITGGYASNEKDRQIIGSIAGGLYGGYIENCFSEVNLNIGGGYQYYSQSFAGGIAGSSDSESFISGCHNKGNILIAHGSSPDSSYVGGIIGKNEGTVQYCSSSGDISVSNSYRACSGGIAGINRGSIHCSYSKGGISAFNSSSKLSGGIAGESFGTVNNCYSLSNMKTYGDFFYGYGFSESGGIVGSGNNDKIMNTYATGNISALDGGSVIVSGIKVFYNEAGGIAGSSKQIQNSIALNSSISIGEGDYIGRIVGYLWDWDGLSNNKSIAISGLPDGTLNDKNGETVTELSQAIFSGLGWKFGNTPDDPWRWDNAEQRPKLFWE